jgi:hypothetical protein
MNIQEFKNNINIKDAELNRTYLWIETDICRYGQHYQNATSTIDDMLNRFVMFYYPIYQNDLVENTEQHAVVIRTYGNKKRGRVVGN